MASNPFDDAAGTGENPFESANTQPFNPADVFGDGLPAAAPAPAPVHTPTPPPQPQPTLEFQPPPPADPSPPPAVPDRKSKKPQAAAAADEAPQPASAILADTSFDFEAPAAAAASAAAAEGKKEGEEEDEDDVPAEKRRWYHFLYKVSWYRPYFDVDTSDVALRMLAGLVPVGKGFFARVGERADLYGPVWLTTTLLFLLAIASNFAAFIGYWWAGHTDQWEYDFYKVAVGAGVYYGYVAAVPIVLWAVQKWWVKAKLTLVACWCLYGYMLTPFLLATPVCIAPTEWLRWVAIMLACAVSSLCLVVALWPPFKAASTKKAIPTIAVAAALNVALAFVYKIYFFSPVQVILSSSN